MSYTSEGFITEDPERLKRMTDGVMCCHFPEENFAFCSGAPWNRLYHRRLFAYDDVYFIPTLKAHEDGVFNMYAHAHTKKFGYLPHPYYHYRYIASSIVNKYNPKRSEIDKEVAEEILKFQEKYRPDESFNQARLSVIVDFFFRLNGRYFFNKENPQSFTERLHAVRDTLNEEPYYSAIQNVKPAYLSKKIQIALPFAKSNHPFILWIFYCGNRLITRRKRA